MGFEIAGPTKEAGIESGFLDAESVPDGLAGRDALGRGRELVEEDEEEFFFFFLRADAIILEVSLISLRTLVASVAGIILI